MVQAPKKNKFVLAKIAFDQRYKAGKK